MSDDEDTSVDRARAATTVAAVSFGVGVLGAVTFATAYSLGPERLGGKFTQVLGVSLMGALGGIGIGLVVWAHGLMPQGPSVSERKMPGPRPRARRELLDTVEERGEAIGRRGLLGRLLALVGGATGLAFLFPLRSLAPDPFPERTTTGFSRGVRLVTEEGEPVRLGDVDVNGFLTVFPEQGVDRADSQTMLVRVAPELLDALPGDVEGSPEGYLAYSKICTHAGCPVGLYQVESQRLFCPCHQSAFDVLDGAEPVFGPATRPLPRLPIGVDDEGHLIALGDFDRPVGPGFWTYPGQVER